MDRVAPALYYRASAAPVHRAAGRPGKEPPDLRLPIEVPDATPNRIDPPARRPGLPHAGDLGGRRRLRAPAPVAGRGCRAVPPGRDARRLGSGEDGPDRLRHVGRPPLPQRRPPRRRDRADDGPASEGRTRPGGRHHPRAERLRRRPTRTTRPGKHATETASGEVVPAPDRLVVLPDPGRRPAAIYPIDQTDGGEDDDPAEHKRKWAEELKARWAGTLARPWKSQMDALGIEPADYISDSRRGDLEHPRKPGDRERPPDGRAPEHVRARPPVRPPPAGRRRQERGAGPRPDRHDVQPPGRPRSSATSPAPT